MSRVFFAIAAAFMLVTLLIVTGAMIVGRGIPEGWQVIYARRELSGHWTLHVADTSRGVTRAYQPGYRFANEPHLSPDQRFVLWQEAHTLKLLDFETHVIRDFLPGYTPVWSPDSRAFAYVFSGDIFVTALDVSGAPGDPVRLTPTRSDASRPHWSPDGAWLVFQNYRDNHQQVFIVRRNGANLRQIDINREDAEISPTWSPDGRQLALAARVDDNLDIYVIDRDGVSAHRLTTHNDNDFAPLWSPDGRYLLFASDRRYIRGELRLATPDDDMPSRSLDVTVLVTSGVRWSPDSTRVVFISGDDGELYSVDIEGGTVRQLTNENTSHRLP